MYRVELVFGHFDRHGLPLPKRQVAAAEELALVAFSRAFRGGQSQDHTGGYLTNEGQLIVEPCTAVWAYASDIDGWLNEFQELASQIAGLLLQERVLLTVLQVNATAYWVTSEPTDPRGTSAGGMT